MMISIIAAGIIASANICPAMPSVISRNHPEMTIKAAIVKAIKPRPQWRDKK